MLLKHELGSHFHDLIGPVFLQALTELWTATLMTVLVVVFVGSVWGGWWLVGFLGLLIVLTIPLLFSKQLPRFVVWLKTRGWTYAWIDKLQMTLEQFAQLISAQATTKAWRFWGLLVGLGLAAQVLNGGLLWYVVSVTGVHIGFVQALFAAAMTVLIQGIFTIIPGGLGVTEGGLVGILLGFGMVWQKTVVVTLLYRLATLPLGIVIALIFLAFMYAKELMHAVLLKQNPS